MADLTYEIEFNLSQVRQQAEQIRQLFTTQLSQIKLGGIDKAAGDASKAAAAAAIEGEKRITAQTRAEAQARVIAARSEANERAQHARVAANAAIEEERRVTAQVRAEAQARSSAQSNTGGGALGGLGKAVVGGLAGYLTVQAGREVLQQATAFAELGTQVRRAEQAFNILSGGAQIAERRIRAIQEASNGTISEMDAIAIGTQATNLKLAKTTEEFEKLTRAGRAIALVSPTIHDVNDALTQLSLFSSNPESFMRADQLGLTVEEVKDRMRELKAENEGLDDSQAKLQASIEILNEKFGGILDSSEAGVSGVEKLRVAFSELQADLASGGIGQATDAAFGDAATQIDKWRGLFSSELSDVQAGLQGTINNNETWGAAASAVPGLGGYVERLTTRNAAIQQTIDLIERLKTGIDNGVPGAKEYAEQVVEIAHAIIAINGVSGEQIDLLREISNAYNVAELSTRRTVEAMNQTVDTSALDASVEKAQNLQQFSDTAERVQELLAKFDNADISLPGFEQAREDVLKVGDALVNNREVTEDMISALDQAEGTFNAVTGAADGMGQSAMNAAGATEGFRGVPFVLGGVEAAAYNMAAGFDEAKRAADSAATAAAIALSKQYQLGSDRATSALESSARGLVTSGLATSDQAYEILEAQQSYLDQAIAQLKMDPDLKGAELDLRIAELTKFAQAPFVQMQEDAKEKAAAEAKAAREAESAFKKAAREAERAFEKAAKEAFEELRSDIESTPGLFGTSPVTQEQMDLAAGGVAQDQFADNWLRRLKDEVFNKVDWAGVDIGQGIEALKRVGINPANNNETIIKQLEQAWANSSLFAAEENLALIDQDAVKANQDLQEKIRTGRENIFAFFGAAADSANAAIAAAQAGGTPVIPGIGPLSIGSDALAGAGGKDGQSASSIGEQIAKGAAGFDFSSTAATIAGQIRAGLQNEKITNELLAIGGSVATILRDGFTSVAGEGGWMESIRDALVADVLNTLAAGAGG